jgi:hypothetical protein
MIGEGSQVPADWVVEFAKVVGSGLASIPGGESKPVQYSVAGVPELDLSGDTPQVTVDDDTGEVDTDRDVYSALGVTGRPLPPGDAEFAEVVCVRMADGLVPIAVRDIRLRMGGNAPGEGTVALVGYAGGYHSITPVDNTDLDKGSIHVIYCPFDFSGGVAQKAHVITLDPTSGNESISLVHADGQAIFLQSDDSIQLQSNGVPAGTTTKQSSIKIEPGKITLQADQIVNNGSVYVGDPLLGVPLLAGVLSAPCPRFFVAPTP